MGFNHLRDLLLADASLHEGDLVAEATFYEPANQFKRLAGGNEQAIEKAQEPV